MRIPQPLVDTIARRRSFAIVGAGFSKNAVLRATETMPNVLRVWWVAHAIAGSQVSDSFYSPQ